MSFSLGKKSEMSIKSQMRINPTSEKTLIYKSQFVSDTVSTLFPTIFFYSILFLIIIPSTLTFFLSSWKLLDVKGLVYRLEEKQLLDSNLSAGAHNLTLVC